MMRFIETPCKFCGRPAVARFEDGAPEEAVNQWLKMLTHDACADALRKRNDTKDRIYDLCFMLERGEKNKDKLSKIRIALTHNTKLYAEAINKILEILDGKKAEVMWYSSFVDLLMEQPEKVSQILYKYRDAVRDLRVGKQPEIQ